MESMEIGILLIVATFVFIVVLIKLSSRSNSSSKLTNWPVVGMFPGLIYYASQFHDVLTSILQQSNGTFMFKGPLFCNLDTLVTSDPINVNHILSKNFSNYPKGPDYIQIMDYLGDGIFNVDSHTWQIQRIIIHSLFKDERFDLSLRTSIHQKISQGLFSVLDNACESTGNNNNEVVDLKDIFQRFSFDNICLLVFGVDPNTLSVELPHIPFEKAFDDIGKVFFYRHIVPSVIWKLQRWLQIGEEKKMTKACRTFDHFVENCIKKKEQQLIIQQKTKNNLNEIDALTYFLQMEDRHENNNNNQNGKKLSNKVIKDIAVNLFGAGRDTTSAALSWTFWLIMTNPSSQKKILEEMEQHFGTDHDHDDDKLRFLDFEKMGELVYLHGAICEALRLYPPVPLNHKVPVESDILPSGHHVLKNTRILYSSYAMGRMTEIWGEDCLEFKPERWISESSGGVKHYPSYKFIAFNAGPRTCLGKDMTFLPMKAVVCAILWNYSLQLIENQNASPSSSMILHLKNGLKVKVYKRSSAD